MANLSHGYTNATTTAHGIVYKRYLGPDATRRHDQEREALTALRGYLPVPAVLGDDNGVLAIEHVPGVHAQELLDAGFGDRVLQLTGGLLRSLHALAPTLLSTSSAGEPGVVLVHGDFGPQNLLIDPETWTATALVDWEFSGRASAVEDIAWAEWIVRMHHPEQVRHLDSLFAAFGDRPPWRDRHDAMLRKCEWALEFVRRWGRSDDVWRARMAATAAFDE
jgi:aminoglycoside phosphotransferase